MRTTLELPADLLEEARQLLGYKSKTDVIVEALRQLVRAHKRQELQGLAGKVAIEVDLAESRRRPKQEPAP